MRRQRGVTLIGWIFLLAPMAVVLYALIRVGPEYYGYYKLVSAMKGTAADLKVEEGISPQTVRSALARRFDVNYVDVLNAEEITVVKEDTGWVMAAEYEKEVDMFGNVALLLKFNKKVLIN